MCQFFTSRPMAALAIQQMTKEAERWTGEVTSKKTGAFYLGVQALISAFLQAETPTIAKY